MDLRYSGKYTVEESINGDFKEITPSYYPRNNGVYVHRGGDGWIWHDIEGCNRIAKDRISLSVIADSDLLHKLDRLLLEGRFEDNGLIRVLTDEQRTRGCYKTDTSVTEWCRRQDPITMYFDEKVSEAMLEAIAIVTKDYRRIPDRKLPGMIPDKPWIANEPYITQYQIDSLVKEANEIDEDLAIAIERYLDNNASTGMYHSCKKLLEDYKHYKTI